QCPSTASPPSVTSTPSLHDALPIFAARIRAEVPGIAAASMFGDRVRAGFGAGPSLFVHDLSPVQLAGRWTPSPLEYRGFMLAGEGDFVALWMPRNPAFEAYCRDVLGLGAVEVLRSEEHTSELQSRENLVCRLLLEKKKAQ